MKLDFLISASPTEGFFSQIAFFRLALDALGGDYRAARLVAVFGDHTLEEIPDRWHPYFERIDVVWAHPIGAENPFYRAQHDRRFDVIRDEADLAFLCDADVVPMAPFDALADQIITRQAVAGVIAHFHFLLDGRERLPDVDWPELALAVLGRDIERPYRYTLMPEDAPPQSPFYLNYGVFAGTPKVLRAFSSRDTEIRDIIGDAHGHFWAPQISLTLTCEALGLSTIALPMRYNFPNDPIADVLYPQELKRVIFMHYLRLRSFRRDQIFADPKAFKELMTIPLEGSNNVFRNRVREITGGSYPFTAR